MNKKQKLEAEARDQLLKYYIRPTTRLGIIIKGVSQSGMSRRMRVIAGESMSDITYLIGQLCDLPVNNKGLLVSGCGMDMTFWLADTITYNLWGSNKPEDLKGNGGGCLDWNSF